MCWENKSLCIKFSNCVLGVRICISKSQEMGRYTGLLFTDVKITRDTSSENYFEHAPTLLRVKIESVNIAPHQGHSLSQVSVPLLKIAAFLKWYSTFGMIPVKVLHYKLEQAKACFLDLQVALHDLHPHF